MTNGRGTLRISELFGPTLQGEGPDQGSPALFVRLAGCDLSCSWCDTPYTWDWDHYDRVAETHSMAVSDVAAWATARPARLVVMTGGEPMLQSGPLTDLAFALRLAGKTITVETNGRHPPDRELAGVVLRFVVSPKVTPSSGQVDRALRHFDHWRPLIEQRQVAVKLVVADQTDLDAAAAFVIAEQLPADLVWLMPEGRSPDVIQSRIPWLFDVCAERGWNLTSRLHVLAHGDNRGH